VGMFVYILVISKNASLKVWSYGISCRSFISCIEFFTLKQYGRGIYVCNFLISAFAALYAGAFFQLTIGLMGASVLCILISPLILGAVGVQVYEFPSVFFGYNVLAFVYCGSEFSL
jgi:hypothetical protein